MCPVLVLSAGARLQEQIDARIDLAVRMADEKWRLARNAYDRFDVSIRRLDADLRRMEASDSLTP